MATNTIGAGVVLNEGQIDVDFRVEGNNNANVLMVDGGNDRVGIGIAAPTQQLNIHGGSSNGELSVNSNGNDAVIYLSESNTDPTTYGAQLYYSNVDDAFHIKVNDGVTTRTGLTVLRSDGKVGIGRTPTNREFEVGGNIRLELAADDNNILEFRNDSKTKVSMGYNATADAFSLSHLDAGSAAINTDQFILKDGDVGIGTDSPDQLLELQKENHVYLKIDANAESKEACVKFADQGVDKFTVGKDGSNAFGIYNHAIPTWSFYMLSDGKVGIGTTTPAQKLSIFENAQNWSLAVHQQASNGYGIAVYMDAAGDEPAIGVYNSVSSYTFKTLSGGTTYTSDGNVSSLSDKRVKEDIKDLTDGLDILNNLKPRTFKYNGLGDMFADGKTIQGFVADEVMDVVPQYVEISKGMVGDEEVEDFKSLSTGKFIPMIVKSIQELSAKVEALENA
jgi:hypothetical protein